MRIRALFSKDAAAAIRTVARGEYPISTVCGLSIHDMRLDAPQDHDQVRAIFEEATAILEAEEPAFLSLVTSEIHRVNVWDVPKEGMSFPFRSFSTPLPLHERWSPRYLACRLVWVATYFAAQASVPWLFRWFSKTASRRAATTGWLAFADRFANQRDEWRAYLSRHNMLAS
jgi:hypothetical protein